ncbi:MAG TPA: hypothetical protein VGC72_05965 [Candidatus Elarobacter sp.]|jgi:hypothetical protein
MLVLTEAAWGNLRGFVAFADADHTFAVDVLRNAVDNQKFLWTSARAPCAHREMPV